MRVTAFPSRGLSKGESRYPAHKLEFLALTWAVTEKFCDYLYGGSFTAVTDSNLLTYILTTAKLDATSYCWLSDLSTLKFHFSTEQEGVTSMQTAFHDDPILNRPTIWFLRKRRSKSPNSSNTICPSLKISFMSHITLLAQSVRNT